jgi:ATP/maltotriose-dependent transcriptional regulator MalT
LAGRGVALLFGDQFADARRDLVATFAAFAAYRRQGASLPWELIGLEALAETEYRLETWDRAIALSERAASLAEHADQDWLAVFVHAVAVPPLAAAGAFERAAAHTAAAAEYQQATGTSGSLLWVASARALAAQADGDADGVVAALRPLEHLVAGTPLVGAPTWQPWRAWDAEAMASLGRLDESEEVLAPLESLVSVRGPRSALVATARARGALEAGRGRPARAEVAFRRGLEEAGRLAMPFERALLEAAYGRFLHRAGRDPDAVTLLAAARARFARLGARPYRQRCDRELASCTEGQTRPKHGLQAALTPQELAVATRVAGGRTNRQAATELVVSVKTIEYLLGQHLRQARGHLQDPARARPAPRLGGSSCSDCSLSCSARDRCSAARTRSPGGPGITPTSPGTPPAPPAGPPARARTTTPRPRRRWHGTPTSSTATCTTPCGGRPVG